MKMKDYDKGTTFLVTSNSCEYFKSADVYDTVGKLPKGTVYDALQYSEGKQGGFYWATFKMQNGETYWVVLLGDRIKVQEPEPDDFISRKEFVAYQNEVSTAFKSVANSINELTAAIKKNATDIVALKQSVLNLEKWRDYRP